MPLTEVQLLELLANANAAAEQGAERVSVSTEALLGLLAFGNASLEVPMRVDSVSQIFDATTKVSEMVVLRCSHGNHAGKLELVLAPVGFQKLREKRTYKMLLTPCEE